MCRLVKSDFNESDVLNNLRRSFNRQKRQSTHLILRLSCSFPQLYLLLFEEFFRFLQSFTKVLLIYVVVNTV